MKNKEIQEEIIVDYVAKERAERTCGNSVLKECFTWLAVITYTSYACYSIIRILNEKQMSDESSFYSFFLMLIFMCLISLALMYVMFPADGIDAKIKAARKFLLEAGQEATSENINLLLNRYYKGNWPKIEDMLYEKRTVFSAESVELVSGNISENSKEAIPVK
jgi:hypothetical protein